MPSSSYSQAMSYHFKTRSEATPPRTPASSEEQQRKIHEVRELLGDDLQTEMPSFLSNGTIRRFLRARNWNTEQATKAVKETIKWRRQYKPDEICWDDLADRENGARKAYLPDYVDKNGRKVFVTMVSMKTKTSGKEQIKHLVYYLENMSLNSEHGEDDNVVWICDFRGWTLSSTPLWESRESLYIIQNYYPGLIAAAIVSNPPKIFESFWKILKHFIEPAMHDKVKFVYTKNSESQRIMEDLFDLDKLESVFGGRNTSGLDIVKYADRMRRQDQFSGCCKNINVNTSST
ncbi:hypothetical protein QOZ80_5AG0400560 [Eleusine coracana subsp. coracana]|nr:hypothetical protein QOZ80_5AG0400560 [Eleusine coracana subsp. coracana]